MHALTQHSTGHDWKKAPHSARQDFCQTHMATEAPNSGVDAGLLHDALAIIFATDKTMICDISLGDAADLILRAKESQQEGRTSRQPQFG
jgi:hypothetical protein